MAELQTIEPPQQQEPPLRKLYNGLRTDGKYTKSFDEFKAKYSTPESIDKLYTGLHEDGDYTKSKDEFQQQYFSDVKKKVGSNDLHPVSDNGLSSTPKLSKDEQRYEELWGKGNVTTGLNDSEVNEYKQLSKKLNKPAEYSPEIKEPITPSGQLPEVKNSLEKFGIKAPVIPKEQSVNQAVSTQAVQPKITASYDDFVEHNAERKEKKAALVKEAIDNAAKKVLKNKGVIKPEEEGKALNLSQFQQLTTEKKRLQEAYDNGDATFAISKDGEVGLNKTVGFLDALIKGWNHATKANDDAAEFADMSAEQKVDYLKKQEVEQAATRTDEYIGERSSNVGSIGQLAGENAPFLGKAIVGGVVGTGLAAAAPATGGFSLAGLPTATAFIFTANDSKNQGIQGEVTRRFYQIKQENPEMDDVAAMKEAEKGTLVGGMAGILTNAALMTSIKTPLSNVAKGVVGKSITKAVGNAVYGGAATAGIEGAKLAEGNLEGIKATPTEIAKHMGTTFSETATTLGLLHVMTGAATGALKLPNVVKSAFKYALKDGKPNELKATLDANVKAGTITQEVADKTLADQAQYNAALSKTPNGLSPEAEASVAGLIQAKDKLIAEMKTKDDTAKPYYEEKIAGINEQIQKTVNTGKPYAHEIDEISGDKYTSNPIDKPVLTETEQPKGQGIKGEVQPTVTFNSKGESATTTTVLEPKQNEPSTVKGETFKLGDQDTFYHASSKPREGRLREGTAPQFGKGVYFSTSKEDVVGEFGDHVTEAKLDLQNPLYTNTPEWGEVQKLAIKKADEAYGKKHGLKLGEDDKYYKYDPEDLSELAEIPSNFVSEAAKELGYDAIIDKDKMDYGNEIVVLDESKIKYPEDEVKTENNPIQNETKATEIPIGETKGSTTNETTTENIKTSETGTGEGGKQPPKVDEPVSGEGEVNKFRDKGILNRLHTAENVPAVSKKGFEEKGLKYEPQTHQEAEAIGKAMVDQYGIDDAVTLAETAKFKGGVNSAIFADSLNRLFNEEQAAKTPEAKLDAAKRFAEVGIRYDEFSRGQGRDISQIGYFYKKSPLGIKLMEETRRREDFAEFSKKKDQSWKEFFDEMTKDPEFEKEIKGKVQEELKKEREEARAKRIKKVDAFFDDAINKLKNGGAAYSTFVPISPKTLATALEGMKKAYHAGEKVAKIIEDAIDYINKEVGGGWDKDTFKKEWETKLSEQDAKMELPTDKRERILERFKKKLKGLSDKEKEDVIRKSFKKLIENGALEYADFKKIIAETLGYGEMSPEQAKKLVDLVEDINKVNDMATKLIDGTWTEKGLNDYLAAKKKAEKSSTELGKLVFNKPEILKRILSVMQLNTLGIPSLVNNPIFNVVNQATVRAPRSLIMTGLDYGIQQVGKAFGKDIPMQNNIFAGQREFWRKLNYGSKQSVEQLITGLTNSDYFQKEVRTSQIHPVTSMKELWAFSQGDLKLTQKQVIDKTIQATVGVPAEVVARVLNIGDKPQRFAAEGSQAATFAKNLGLQGIGYKMFMEFPKEVAYREFKKQGLSDEVAMKKAEDTQSRIIKEGEESVFQEDNLLNDVINGAFEALKKGGDKAYGFGQIVKTLNMPFVKIPLNAYWSTFNLANPEVAFLQSLTYAAKAYKTKSPLDIQQSKKWFAHGVTGLAWMGVTGALAKEGIVNAGNADDTTKKEREGEQFYEQQSTINMSKFYAAMAGENPKDVKGGLNVDLKWFGNMGVLMGYQARRLENMTPEQKQNGTDMMEDMMGNLTESAIDFADKGVFSNSAAMFQAISKGGRWMDGYMLNLINMGTNIVHPAAFAQMERAALPYYTKAKADSFQEEIKNSLLTRSAILRKLNDKYPPSKVSIWGDQLDKKDNWAMRLFSISRSNDDNFAQPLYKDYKRTNNTKFFPPSVKPSIKEGDKTVQLTAKETAELETLVGQSRKQLVAPYVNDMATFEGSDKKYSQLSDDEKIKNLNILYQTGYEAGEAQFLALHPQYKAAPKSEDQIEKEQEMESNNKLLRATSKEKMNIPANTP